MEDQLDRNPSNTALSAKTADSEAADQAATLECHLVANRPVKCSLPLTGHLARRKVLPAPIVWDTELAGFGLRAGTRHKHSWILKLRERGRQRLITLGKAVEVSADAARRQARELLERATLDGLSVPTEARPAPLFRTYVAEFWRDYAHHWKPSTRRSNDGHIRRQLLPEFGELAVDAITRADVLHWRDALFDRGGAFNRALPVLAVMLTYSEQLGYRRRGSNPCKGVPRHKRTLPERYLSAAEYRRLGRVLSETRASQLAVVTILRLLIYTGARKGEIESLRWESVQLPRLMLPDSKTGPKVIWLNRPACAVLDSWARGRKRTGYVFPGRKPDRHVRIDVAWPTLRRRAALPDVRIHDLRHSFASVAIADNISLTMIGRLLGHVLPETTARYAHLADELVADAADRICGGLAQALRITA